MFEFRQKGDYGDFVRFEKEKVQVWLKRAEDFINAIDEVMVKIIEEEK